MFNHSKKQITESFISNNISIYFYYELFIVNVDSVSNAMCVIFFIYL